MEVACKITGFRCNCRTRDELFFGNGYEEAPLPLIRNEGLESGMELLGRYRRGLYVRACVSAKACMA